MKAIDELRKTADECTTMAGVENKFETVWITKKAFMNMLDSIERELEEEYVALPKDANGEPIHVGDVLYSTIDGDMWHGTVSHMLLQDEGWTLGDTGYFADALTHHQPPTVEDVLWELLSSIRPEMEDDEAVPIVRGFAERLQLKERDDD